MGDPRRHLALSVGAELGASCSLLLGPCLALSRALVLPWGSWGAACGVTVPLTSPLPPEPLSSVSSLEVHFDLLDLTELTDMSDQELAEVFADSDDENLAENLASDPPAGEAGAGPPWATRAGPGAQGLQTLLPSNPYF